MSARGLVAVAFAAPWLVWALVRVAGLDPGHPVTAAMAFTPYAALTSPLPVVAALVMRRRAVALVATLAAIALVAVVVPRTIDGAQHASAAAHGPRLTVMTLNVFGGGADARSVVRLARERDVDVLSLQELTPDGLRELDAAGADELLPHRAVQPHPGAAGSGLMARLALDDVTPPDATGAAQPEAALRVPGAKALRIKAVHPYPPISPGHVADWRREFRELPGPNADGALRILAGDFNATLDHHAFRALLDRGYVDAADATGDGLRPTWPFRRPGVPITIDHILMPPGVKVRRLSVHDIDGSDHRAVIAELVLPAA